jgi:hypothetical protein
MAWKASVTAMLVLSVFAIAGQYIFRMFGITLPAFEIAGGVILLLIGLDMLEAKRSPTQESHIEAAEAALKEDAGIVPLGIPMLAARAQSPALWCWWDRRRPSGRCWRFWGDLYHCRDLLPGAGELRPCGASAGRDRGQDSGPHHGLLLVALAVSIS